MENKREKGGDDNVTLEQFAVIEDIECGRYWLSSLGYVLDTTEDRAIRPEYIKGAFTGAYVLIHGKVLDIAHMMNRAFSTDEPTPRTDGDPTA